MKQTPINDICNDDALKLIPEISKKIIEIGCGSGALAREFKKSYPDSYWVGVEIDAHYAELAKRYCDITVVTNIDECNEDFYYAYSNSDCWIFADVLEHLRDPWNVIRNIRNVIPNYGCVIASIPNVQNWSVISKLVTGDFRYEDYGLLDRTHLRWFTKKTIAELFLSNSFAIDQFYYRSFHNPDSNMIQLFGKIAEIAGGNPSEAMIDSIPFQYIIRATPA